MGAHDIHRVMCPKCGAELEAADTFCCRCGERVVAPAVEGHSSSRHPGPARRAVAVPLQPRRDLAESRAIVLLLLFAVLGPLALPVLWRSTRFSLAWKIVLTILVLIFTAIVVGVLWYAVYVFVEALRQSGIVD